MNLYTLRINGQTNDYDLQNGKGKQERLRPAGDCMPGSKYGTAI